MSPHQIIAVAVRLFAVWLVLSGTGTALSIYFAGDLPLALTIAAVAAILVLALWLFPQTIARKLLSSPVSESAATATPDLWLTMGCSLIGLWLLSSALPAVISNIFVLHFKSSALDDSTRAYVGLARYLLEIVIALWLILGAKGFRKVYWWAQNAGRK